MLVVDLRSRRSRKAKKKNFCQSSKMEVKAQFNPRCRFASLGLGEHVLPSFGTKGVLFHSFCFELAVELILESTTYKDEFLDVNQSPIPAHAASRLPFSVADF